MPELDPIFITVKDAARMLGVSTWTTYQLLDSQTIASQYHGRKRLVVLTSLREYAEGLPTSRPEVAS
jgi:excisionase family DNA binding protein